MLFKNDFFTFAGERYRLLYRDKDSDLAFALNIDDRKAWPREFSWSGIKKLPKLNPKALQAGRAFSNELDYCASDVVNNTAGNNQVNNVEGLEASRHAAQSSSVLSTAASAVQLAENATRQELLAEQQQIEAQQAEGVATPSQVLRALKKGRVLSDAQVSKREWAAEMLGPLMNEEKSAPGIFEPKERCRMIKARAEEAGCTVTVLYKHLRQFWLGGQTTSALTAPYENCGRSRDGETGRRGAKPESGRDIYQLSEDDHKRFEAALQTHYLVENSVLTINDTYDLLLEDYRYLDGEGNPYLKDHGERPSVRQFRYYLASRYTKDDRLRARLTTEEYKQRHREVLGTVLEDCDGIGHYYEADATIADVFCVATNDVSNIIGKPTIYLIIDRKSRLIVGWYVGLENPSWICAMQAMVSIAQDKQAICERLGVSFDPEDWPAHQMFPRVLLADRGELLSAASDQIVVELGVHIGNLPKKRPEWKPVVECSFKQTRAILQAGAPGFDPPENARLRQAKDYSKESCLTLQQFEKIILLAIIKHNRDPLTKYQLSLSEIGNKVLPIPIDLWNFDMESDNGRQVEYSEEFVRMALLERQTASVTLNGIKFGGCFYASIETSSKGWFSKARAGVFKVTVAFDRRLVDTVYAYDPKHPEEVYECKLTARSERFSGLSFVEVANILKEVKGTSEEIEQIRRQNKANFNSLVQPVYAGGKKALKEARLTSARKSRRADTVQARADGLRAERQELAAPMASNAVADEHASVPAQASAQLTAAAPRFAFTNASSSLAQPPATLSPEGQVSALEANTAADAKSAIHATAGASKTQKVQTAPSAPTHTTHSVHSTTDATAAHAPAAAPARPLTAAEKLQKRKQILTQNV